VAYGARLESVLGATPRGFESRILRHNLLNLAHPGVHSRLDRHALECTRLG
jgi:hypothetical protein